MMALSIRAKLDGAKFIVCHGVVSDVASCGRDSEMGPVIATVNTGTLIFRIFLLCNSLTLKMANRKFEPL
jgi:hypothetical protein